MVSISLTFCYNPNKHPLLHEWLSSIEYDRSHRIREMLERGLKGDQNTLLEQILGEVQAIRSQGWHNEPVKVLSEGDLPTDILANLQGLGE